MKVVLVMKESVEVDIAMMLSVLEIPLFSKRRVLGLIEEAGLIHVMIEKKS